MEFVCTKAYSQLTTVVTWFCCTFIEVFACKKLTKNISVLRNDWRNKTLLPTVYIAVESDSVKQFEHNSCERSLRTLITPWVLRGMWQYTLLLNLLSCFDSGLVSSAQTFCCSAFSSVRSGRSSHDLVQTVWTRWNSTTYAGDVVHLLHAHRTSILRLQQYLGVYNGDKESCLSVNRREVGLHNSEKGPENLCRLLTVWREDFVRFPPEVVRLHWDGTPLRNHQHFFPWIDYVYLL